MKHDITNDDGDLSRKIKALFCPFILLIAILWGLPAVFADSAKNSVSITVDGLRSLPPDQGVIIDTRSSWKYFLGHIPGSLNLPDWQDFTHVKGGVKGLLIEDPDFIVGKLRPLGIDGGKTIVLYGDPADRWRTDGRFFWMFERFGFESVVILSGGLDRWTHSGGAIERGRPGKMTPSSLSVADIRFNDQVAAAGKWIHSRLESGKLAIIDNRTKKEFDGATPYGSKRGGHIPKAIHIPWEAFFTADGALKDKKTLTGLLEQNAIRPDQEIVVYCTGGVRSGMAYYAFRSLGYSVRNYDGSWWDWSLQSELPVEEQS